MFEIRDRQLSIMVCSVIVLHMIWAIVIWVDPSATNPTAVHALYKVVGDQQKLAVIIGGAAILATIGLFSKHPWIVLLLLPQQILLLVSMAGAIEAMWLGQFADGVIRPRAFIIADQVYSVVAALGHTVAVVIHALRISK